MNIKLIMQVMKNNKPPSDYYIMINLNEYLMNNKYKLNYLQIDAIM